MSKNVKRYKWNTFILEISNNWGDVKRLYNDFKNGTFKAKFDFENNWIKTLVKNKINLDEYGKEDDDKFLNDWFVSFKDD